MEAVYQELCLKSIKTTQYELFQSEYRIGGGVGDILLRAKDGSKRLAVVEVKYIDIHSEGRTARTRRRNKRNKVEKQAWRYGKAVKTKYLTYKVMVCIYTNERGLVKLGEL